MMDRLELQFPTAADGPAVWDYRQEFIDHGDSMDGCLGLRDAESFDAWLRIVEENRKAVDRYQDRVPSDEYLVILKADHRLVGMCNIRRYLDEKQLRHGGSIGYSVRFSERKNGYGTELLRLALPLIRATGQTRALVTCYKENLGSQGVIRNNGGIFQDEFFENGHTTQRHWIDLEQ